MAFKGKVLLFLGLIKFHMFGLKFSHREFPPYEPILFQAWAWLYHIQIELWDAFWSKACVLSVCGTVKCLSDQLTSLHLGSSCWLFFKVSWVLKKEDQILYGTYDWFYSWSDYIGNWSRPIFSCCVPLWGWLLSHWFIFSSQFSGSVHLQIWCSLLWLLLSCGDFIWHILSWVP